MSTITWITPKGNLGIVSESQFYSKILEAVSNLEDFKKIVYKNNEFSHLSLEQISPIVQRKIPFHLEELRIENCKIEKDVTLKLIKILNDKSYI